MNPITLQRPEFAGIRSFFLQKALYNNLPIKK